jgi:hypothetical protein
LIRSVGQLVEATAFERFALAAALPLVNQEAAAGSVDFRGANTATTIIGYEALGTGLRDDLLRNLRPLLFGAAWKILDNVIEYGINLAPGAKEKVTIRHKREKASAGPVRPFDTENELWVRISGIYDGTAEARHCLIHRGFELAPDGTMTKIHDPLSNVHYPDIAADEQDAICRLSQRVLLAVETERLGQRDRMDTVHCLDRLTRHHRQSVIGGGTLVGNAVLVIIDAIRKPAGWCVDVPTVLARAREACPNARCFDVEIWFPATGLPPIRGRLEEAPLDAELIVDPSAPPAWVCPL